MSVIVKVPKLRFKEFSDEWSSNTLIELSSGKFSNGVFNDPKKIGNGYKLINVKDMYIGNSIDISNLTLLELEEKEFINNKVEYGDILFTRSSIVKEGIAYSNVYLSQNTNTTYDGHLIKMCPNQDKIKSKFLILSLKTLPVRKQLIIRGKTTTMTTIGQQDISSVNILYPSHLEQKKIASFLTSVESKIEQLTKKEQLLVKYKKGVMQKIFSQEIRFKDDEDNSFSDWEEKKLDEFLILTLRELPKPKVNYLALGIRSHCKGTFQKPDSDPSKIAMDKLYEAKENDLIVSITFAWESAIAMVKKEDEGGLVSHRFPTYTFDRDIVLHEYFKYLIIQKRFRYMLDLISPGGAGRNRVMSKREFVKLKLDIPSVEEQKKIASFLSSIDTKIEQANKQLNQAKQFKKALLQQMFV